MILLYVLFAKFVPIISIWEMKVGDHPSPALQPIATKEHPLWRAAPVNAVYALYPDGHAAQEAVDGLRAAGVADDDITIMSSEPLEDFEFGHRDRENWMWWTASLGGLVGGLSAPG